MAKDYYASLGVDKKASADEIKSAFRKKAKEYHPDVNKDPNASAKFKEINEAYEVLGDEKKRSNYDNFGSAEGSPFGAGGNPFGNGGGFSGFNFGGSSFSFESDDMGDMFSDIFSAFGGGRSARRTTMQGEDINVEVAISFEEAAFGCTKNINLNRIEPCEKCSGTGAKDGKEYETCSDCKGSGRVRFSQQTIFGTTIREGMCKNCSGTGKVIKVKCGDCSGKGYKKVNVTIGVDIPAGIDNDQMLRMRGQGNSPETKGGVSGDLNIKVKVKSHKILVRDGNDLKLEINVPFTTLMLGGKIAIPTLQGNYDLEIKELTQSGTVLRIKNKGLKALQREYYGDMLVTLKCEFPKKLDNKTRDKLKEISALNTADDYSKYKDYLKSLN